MGGIWELRVVLQSVPRSLFLLSLEQKLCQHSQLQQNSAFAIFNLSGCSRRGLEKTVGRGDADVVRQGVIETRRPVGDISPLSWPPSHLAFW